MSIPVANSDSKALQPKHAITRSSISGLVQESPRQVPTAATAKVWRLARRQRRRRQEVRWRWWQWSTQGMKSVKRALTPLFQIKTETKLIQTGQIAAINLTTRAPILATTTNTKWFQHDAKRTISKNVTRPINSIISRANPVCKCRWVIYSFFVERQVQSRKNTLTREIEPHGPSRWE